jgi:hypothetical protein
MVDESDSPASAVGDAALPDPHATARTPAASADARVMIEAPRMVTPPVAGVAL